MNFVKKPTHAATMTQEAEVDHGAFLLKISAKLGQLSFVIMI